MRSNQADIFTVNLESKEIINLTKDKFANYAPTWAPDGRSIVYLVRVSGQRSCSVWTPMARTRC
jgi:Tol biopolymer transport system component